jgi:hypothetical protein
MFILCVVVTPALWAAEPQKKLTQDEAERFVYQCWREFTTEQEGKACESDVCYRLGRDSAEVWLWKGELSIGTSKMRTVIDANADPMRIDFHSVNDDEELVCVIPCIWKMEGAGKDAKLVIVRPDGSEKPRKDGDYSKSAKRPTGFETTKENKYTKNTYAPCDYLEQYDPKKEADKKDKVADPKKDDKK